jgi:hypothetical protein
MRIVTEIATLALLSLWRRLPAMRRTALIFCWLASFSLALSPLATVHAHVSEDEAVIHGGHSHDEVYSHSHADDHSVHSADVHVADDLEDHSTTHLVVQHPGQLAHDHAVDGHIVHCDLLTVPPDTSSKTKVAMGRASTSQPARRAPVIFKPHEPNESVIAQRFYLHPPLRGPPVLV